MDAHEFCTGDFGRAGKLDFFDITVLTAAANNGDPDADLNGEGLIDSAGLTDFVSANNSGC